MASLLDDPDVQHETDPPGNISAIKLSSLLHRLHGDLD